MTTRRATREHDDIESLERVSALLDDDLAPADRQAIMAHLAECPCCRRVLEGLEHTVHLCHDEGQPALPPSVAARARARVADLLARPPHPRRSSRRR